ncbi:MAG: hypothetical protein KH989_07900 [Kocuria rhizophila]|uniref:hypothetical protein n=1 Tax=Kocuria salsicia TaxID=664639 RepID=UPI001EBC038A|nr:hypothetical protein [uncultured Kocuria sp.]MBS6030607.1 hypothetical protein [Kocuria rhizophila]
MNHLIRPLALLCWLFTTALPLRLQAGEDDADRGDVPGWVMLTLMSAVLVAGLLLIARPALEGLFQDAINRVSGL